MFRLLIISRISIALAIVLFVGYIVHQHIPFTGVRVISYTFDRPHGAVGVFRPPVRYELVEHGKRRIAKIIEDPVYFDVKTSVVYASADIMFTYQKHTMRTTQLAVREWQDGWKFSTQPFTEKLVGDWVEARAHVDLSSAVRENGKYTFAFSIPGLVAGASDDSILISDMTITLIRPSVWESL
ncbi:MAG: hypothetical protein AAB400_01295 [Patescibacteria group bacterium]